MYYGNFRSVYADGPNSYCITKLTLPAQRYRIRRRISQLRFLDSALLHPVCEVGRRRIVALRDELLGGPVGEQCLDIRTVLVKLAFTGAFRPSDRQTGSPSRAKGFLRPRGDQPRSISAAIFPPKSRSKSSPKIGRRQIDDIYAVSIGYRKSYGGFGTFEPLGPRMEAGRAEISIMHPNIVSNPEGDLQQTDTHPVSA